MLTYRGLLSDNRRRTALVFRLTRHVPGPVQPNCWQSSIRKLADNEEQILLYMRKIAIQIAKTFLKHTQHELYRQVMIFAYLHDSLDIIITYVRRPPQRRSAMNLFFSRVAPPSESVHLYESTVGLQWRFTVGGA